jgi:rod shape-determining protein MreC
MIDIPSRHRPLALLASVVIVQVLLLAFQITRDQQGQQKHMRLIRLWSVELLTPMQSGGTWMIHKMGAGWHGYVDLRHARKENEELRAELQRLELRNQVLESRAAEADRLAAMLGFRQAHAEVPMLVAEVIGASADAISKTVYINRGSRDGVRRDMGVITPDGVVGKIIEVFSRASQVLLLTDRDSGVGALLATSRTHGAVKGTGDPTARMDYVVSDEKVLDGETVLTAGDDRIFPKDIPIGTVVGTQPGNPFKVITVRPAAWLDRLEEVIVLLTHQELNLRKDTEAAAGTASAPANPPQPAAGAAKPPARSPSPANSNPKAAQPPAAPSPKKPPL